MAMIDTRRWSPAALGLLGILTLLGASSCGEFRFEEQEILIRCDSGGIGWSC